MKIVFCEENLKYFKFNKILFNDNERNSTQIKPKNYFINFEFIIKLNKINNHNNKICRSSSSQFLFFC